MSGIIGIVFLIGYIIFAQANTQRQQFRLDPNKPIWGQKPTFIQYDGARENNPLGPQTIRICSPLDGGELLER